MTTNAVPSIDPADLVLNAGILDVVVNSTAQTFTDRLGNVKPTVLGAIESLKAFNSRGAWVTGTAYAIKDLVSNGGTWYACVVPHTASASFATDTASKWRVHQGAMSADLAAPSGSSLSGHLPNGTGAVVTTVAAKLNQGYTQSIEDFGGVGDGITDNATALGKAKVFSDAGGTVNFGAKTYLTSAPVTFTVAPSWKGTKGARIKLSASAAHVIKIDGSGGYIHGGVLSDFILDGGGFAPYGLELVAVINGRFHNIMATNVTVSGLHLAWAQLCSFYDYTCSRNVEAFTTTPVNGILVDGLSSSANTFINPTIEHVSGSGVKGISLLNSVFINGTSEGNNIGLEFGETVDAGRTAFGNTVIGMDVEVNAVADIVLRLTSGANDFIGLKGGYLSPPVQILGSKNNAFIGGVTSGFNLDSGSGSNTITDVKLLNDGSVVTDAGLRNSWKGVYNISSASIIPDKTIGKGRVKVTAGAGVFVTIDGQKTDYFVVSATGASVGINSVASPIDNNRLDICVRNDSAGALTVTFDTSFKITGWVSPAAGKGRTASFIYDQSLTSWVLLGMSTVDQA